MELGFKTYDITVDNYQTELTVEEAGNVVIAFAEKKDLSTAMSELFIPKNIIDATYKDIREIEAMVQRIMEGKAVVTFAEFDENEIEISPVEYNTIPTTLDELKTLSFNLIARDFDEKVSSSYTIEQIEDLRVKIYFCIDTLIQHSKSTKDGDWIFFSQQF
jgi:hypothetical protein